jgi:3D (Asp-Asp-Asp) domain-containing protein
MEVTAYCSCTKCCGSKATGLTASGKLVTYNEGRFVAADTSMFPFGTKLSIPGYHDGGRVEVIDRGGAIKGNKIDVFFPNHEDAKRWGRKWVAVTIGE